MSKKSSAIQLGALEIEVPQFTLGQLGRIAEWLSANESGDVQKLSDIVRSYQDLLGIALERSSPKYSLEQITDLEMDIQELRQAGTVLLRLAGLQPAEGATDPEVTAPEGASPPTSNGSLSSLPPDVATLPN